jgi:serine/threonine protein kinase
VKIVYRNRFKTAQPYETEFRGLKKFTPISRNHAGLVHILHVGRNDDKGYFFYIMEVAEPETGSAIDPRTYRARNMFSEIARRKRIPALEVLDIGLYLTAALDYLHRRNLVHRDIKPANILFVDGQPKLADIGLVTEASTTMGEVTYVGTPGYIPPEGPGRPEADIYALGMVLYEAVTGQNRKEFPQTSTELESEPGVPELMKIVYQACEHDPLARFQTAAEMHRALLAMKQMCGQMENAP